MKTLVQRISVNARYERLFEWGRLITITGSTQLGIQVISFISGILVIRLLSTGEYALYTLANTMFGTMLILADGGITTGVLAEGGKVWQDRTKFGAVIITGFGLRRQFTLFSLLLAVPALFYLLIDHQAGWKMATLIILSLIPSFFMALSGSLLEIAPKLKQDIAPLQKIQLFTALGRLSLLSACLFSFPMTFIAVLASGLPQIYANRSLRKISSASADYTQKADKKVEQAILKIVKRVLPGSVYYVISAQLTVWLISTFGSTASVAHIGALGRLGMMLTLFTALFNTLIAPRFARLPETASLLLKRFLQLQAGLFIWAILIVAVFWGFSPQALWLLGNQYSGLEQEVVLSIIGTCLSLIAGVTYTLTISRGWTINPVIYIGSNISLIVLGIFYVNVSTLQGILLFNIYIAACQVVMNTTYSFIRIISLKKKQRYALSPKQGDQS
jgi:O-antigen/teichoic acid export membrane protein